MSKRIEYTEGQILGDYGIKYIKEAEPYISPSDGRAIRQAEFECSCGKHFISRIAYIKNGHTKSCGCKALEASIKTIQKYNASEHEVWNREKINKGDIIGDYGVIYIKDIEPHISPKTGRPHRKCKFICPVCGIEFEALLGNVKRGYTKGCGTHMSHGEERIVKILIENNINFEQQKTYKDLKSDKNYALRFDFYLPDYNILIEYDGIQHFKYTDGSCWNDENNFSETQKRDKIKNEYCLKNNIPLIRIPYTDFNKLDYNYLLDRISEVMPNCALLV